MMRVALNEVYYTKLMTLNEAEAPKRPGVLRSVAGPFSISDRVDREANRNKRLYSESLLANKIVNSEYTRDMLENRTLFGEASHPANRFDISIPEVSHNITALEMKEGVVWGKADILDTPAGRILNTLFEYGSTVGISSRAAGSVKKEGDKERVNEEDYTFFTYDFVPAPSFKTARMQSIAESLKPDVAGSIKKAIEKADLQGLRVMAQVLEAADSVYFADVLAAIGKQLSQATDSLAETPYVLLEQAHRKLFELEAQNRRIQRELDAERKKGVSNSMRGKEVDPKALTENQEGRDRLTVSEAEELRILRQKVRERELKESEREVLQVELQEAVRTNAQFASLVKSQEAEISRLKSKQPVGSPVSESAAAINEARRIEKIKEMETRLFSLYEDAGKMREVLESFQAKAVSEIAGRTGVQEEVIRRLLPEDFTCDDLEAISEQVKSLRPGRVEVLTEGRIPVGKAESKGEEDEKPSQVTRVSRLVKSVGN